MYSHLLRKVKTVVHPDLLACSHLWLVDCQICKFTGLLTSCSHLLVQIALSSSTVHVKT